MLRFLISVLFPPFAAAGAGAGAAGPWMAHLVTVRVTRVFVVRARATIIEFGHSEDTDPTLDTE